MINTIDTKINQVEVPNQEQTQSRQYVTMRGNDYERTPDSDTYESSSNKTAKAVGIGAALLAIGATIYAGCHGKNILEKAGKETGFMENIKTGYKNFFKKAENAVVDAEKKVDETAGEKLEETAKKKLDETAEKKLEETAEKKVEETAEKKVEETAEKKVEETAEKKVEETAEKKVEETTEKKAEETAEKKAEEATEKKVEETTEKKAEEATEKNILQIKDELGNARTSLERQKEQLAKLKNELDSCTVKTKSFISDGKCIKINTSYNVDKASIEKRASLNKQIKALEEKIKRTESFIEKSGNELADLNIKVGDGIDKLAQDVVDGKFKTKKGAAIFEQRLNELVDMQGPENRDKAMSNLREKISETAGRIEKDAAKSNGKAQAKLLDWADIGECFE